ncbi:cancer-related nucleoside-triphosphatase isoform X2 [Hyperolius riggenbachi]|uniref:cancer-related nucleoside-triphosphatase isoform X2 n=1 Tax=Hyperolius riggenbachi TaxID=752182 RepID=UPI0035A3C01A
MNSAPPPTLRPEAGASPAYASARPWMSLCGEVTFFCCHCSLKNEHRRSHAQTRVLNWNSRSSQASRKPEYRVGQYVVDITSFEQLVLPTLNSLSKTGNMEKKIVCIIDEIGKMELFSQNFISLVRKMLDSTNVVVLGTIPVPKGKPLPVVEEIRHRQDVKVFNITKENRDGLLQEIVSAVHNCCK